MHAEDNNRACWICNLCLSIKSNSDIDLKCGSIKIFVNLQRSLVIGIGINISDLVFIDPQRL